MAKNSRSVGRARRHGRVRRQLAGTAERPRLNVFRSLSAIYAQVIDDQSGQTLASASTVDRELRIVDAAAAMDAMPYEGDCDRIVPDYRKLVGLAIRPGYTRKVKELLSGVRGCTHITDMLGSLPTAAIQTFAGLQREDTGTGKPFQLDRCHALETTSETVRKYYPRWYRGAA